MIQKIFKNNNQKTLSGNFVVEQLIPLVGAPEIAEAYIMEMIQAGTLLQEGSHLTLNLPSEVETEPETEPESIEITNEEIKRSWFQLREMEKTNPDPLKFKIYVEAFVRKYEWNYYVFHKELRERLEELGYHSNNEERGLFQREVLQK